MLEKPTHTLPLVMTLSSLDKVRTQMLIHFPFINYPFILLYYARKTLVINTQICLCNQSYSYPVSTEFSCTEFVCMVSLPFLPLWGFFNYFIFWNQSWSAIFPDWRKKRILVWEPGLLLSHQRLFYCCTTFRTFFFF